MLRLDPVLRIWFLPLFVAGGSVALAVEADRTILTGNVVELRETVSPQGFVHPGISCDAATLAVMREKVIAGVSPWVDYFEGLRRTRFADLRQRPRLVRQITNDGGIGAFANDAHLAWAQTILYVVTGDEAYRKTPLEIVRWYGSRTDESFFPRHFPDSHIKIGKYVYTLCGAVDILRATKPRNTQLAVTPAMVDALQKHCLLPIRKNCIERNDYFMNQHSYAIMGFLASTILGDEVDGYRRAVEWTTVNAASPNQGRNGSIKEQIRLVERDARTGELVSPRLQVVEMGRDQPHAGGNIDNLLMMSKTIAFQRTKVDPVDGTATKAADGVSPVHYMDDRLPRGAALFAKYNIGYGLEPWVSVFSETDPKHPDYLARYDQISYFGRGSIGGNGVPAAYHYLKSQGFDLEAGPYRYIKVANDAVAVGREQLVRSGKYLDQIHNYAFDFWIGLPASASDAAPDPAKAKRALAAKLPPLQVERDGAPVSGRQFEFQFVDLSAHAMPGDRYPGSSDDRPLRVLRDADGTGYVRMTVGAEAPRTLVFIGDIPPGAGLRVRSDSFAKLGFYRDEDFGRRGRAQELYVPDTRGEWTQVIAGFENHGPLYIRAASLAGVATTLDFDRVETDKASVRPLSFASADDTLKIHAYVGERIEKTITAREASASVRYGALNLPSGARFDAATATLSWTPGAAQAGAHTLYVTAREGETARTLRVDVGVAADLQSALAEVARAYDPAQRYVSTTEQAFKKALAARDLAALKRAADALELLTPRLPDGTLDYRVASSPPERGVAKMADEDPLTFGGVWAPDKNITLDFGDRFKVRAEAFRLQARDGFPARVAGAVVYGSNDGRNWSLLTKGSAARSPDLQTLAVKEEERGKSYRYLRLSMPADAFPIFELSTLRIVGERIEDHGHGPDRRAADISGRDDGISARPARADIMQVASSYRPR